MCDANGQTLQTPTEVIALPPLRMVLVHAVDKRKNEDPKSTRHEEQVDSQVVKKLIAHLEQK
jgi:hypothetical protein